MLYEYTKHTLIDQVIKTHALFMVTLFLMVEDIKGNVQFFLREH